MKLKRIKILLVDDSEFMKKILHHILTREGYEVVGEAYDGSTAIQKYRELKPDLVLMDIILPDPTMNGIETIKWIIKIDPKALIIIVSAIENQVLVNEALSAGAKDYCIKPFDPPALIQIINKTLKDKDKGGDKV